MKPWQKYFFASILTQHIREHLIYSSLPSFYQGLSDGALSSDINLTIASLRLSKALAIQ